LTDIESKNKAVSNSDRDHYW